MFVEFKYVTEGPKKCYSVNGDPLLWTFYSHMDHYFFFLDQLITVQGKQGEVKKQKEYNWNGHFLFFVFLYIACSFLLYFLQVNTKIFMELRRCSTEGYTTTLLEKGDTS